MRLKYQSKSKKVKGRKEKPGSVDAHLPFAFRLRSYRSSIAFVWTKLIIGLLIFTLAAGVTWAQQNRLQQPTRPATIDPSSGVLVSPEEDYRIAPGDTIEVQIEDAPELSGTFRVTSAGTFLMHYLGRLTAQQKTTEDLSKVIADGLRGRYLSNPIVSVAVRQYNSRAFFIQGAVHTPGVYQMEGRPSLLKLLAIAGGLAENHGSSAFIIREIKPSGRSGAVAKNPASENKWQGTTAPTTAQSPSETQSEAQEDAQYELKKVNISGLFKGHFDQDTMLEPGDIVNIPPTEVFFIAGEVQAPGSFPLKVGTTLRQAISLAQGTTFKAAANRGIIFREDPASGERQQIPVDISKVMSGKNDDLVILANDVIIVPNSRMKKTLSPVLTAFGLSVTRLPIRY